MVVPIIPFTDFQARPQCEIRKALFAIINLFVLISVDEGRFMSSEIVATFLAKSKVIAKAISPSKPEKYLEYYQLLI